MTGGARPRKYRMIRHRRTVGDEEAMPTFKQTRELRAKFRDFLARHGRKPATVRDAVRAHLTASKRMAACEA